jgi:hypothetical protein
MESFRKSGRRKMGKHPAQHPSTREYSKTEPCYGLTPFLTPFFQSTTNLADPAGWITLTNLTLTLTNQLWVDTSVNAASPFNPKTFYRVLPGP